MNTVTYWDGKRIELKSITSKEVDAIRSNKNSGYVSYYDTKGDTHVCEFCVIHGGVACLGLWDDLEGEEIYDCTGKVFSSFIYDCAANIVRYKREDFCGWSL